MTTESTTTVELVGHGDRPGSPPRGQHLYIDCFSGVAGDMFLGAMLDLGISTSVLQTTLDKLPLTGYRVTLGRRRHKGIDGCDVKVRVTEGHKHSHTAYRDIQTMIQQAELATNVRKLSLEIFERLARAEGRIHGKRPEEVTFHEVGAVDSVVDIVGAAAVFCELMPSCVTCRTVPVGRGRVACAHGTMPVPAPATMEILKGVPIESGDVDMELCTPTGAAIVASVVDDYGALPAGRPIGVGYGAGDNTIAQRPNHLRVILMESERGASQHESTEELLLLEANVDDMNPEWTSFLTERVLGAGAKDVWYTPVVMKKGRPALLISALCEPRHCRAVGDLILSESTSIGLRQTPLSRRMLQRTSVTVSTPYGAVRVKAATRGRTVINAAPEFEDCRQTALASGAPIKEIYASALAAFRDQHAVSDEETE